MIKKSIENYVSGEIECYGFLETYKFLSTGLH